MAKQPEKSADGAPTKFPANWARMSRAEKLAWQEKNRPGFNAAARAAKAPEPTPAPVPVDKPRESHDTEHGDYPESSELAELDQAAAKERETDVRVILAKLLREVADHLTTG